MKTNYVFISIIIGILISISLLKYIKNKNFKYKNAIKYTTKIEFLHETIDLGTLLRGTNKKVTFEFTNSGKNDLFIFNIETSCGCTISKWSKSLISPGEQGVLFIEFKANTVGYFQKSVFVYANVDHSPVVLKLYGRVIAPQNKFNQ